MKTDTCGSGGSAHGAQQPTVSHRNSVFVHPWAGSNPEPAAWQPIATAPKDGTWILLYDQHTEDGIHTGKWIKTFPNFWGQRSMAGWTNMQSSYSDGDLTEISPTHWMPLPSAPKE